MCIHHNWQARTEYSRPAELIRYQCARCNAWGYWCWGSWSRRKVRPYQQQPSEATLERWREEQKINLSLTDPLGAEVRGWGKHSDEQYHARHHGKLQFWNE